LQEIELFEKILLMLQLWNEMWQKLQMRGMQEYFGGLPRTGTRYSSYDIEME